MRSVLQRLRDRLRGRTTVGPGGGATCDGTVTTGDQSHYSKTLEEFAEMEIVIGSNFDMGYKLIKSMYDRDQQRYLPDSIHDTTPLLYLGPAPPGPLGVHSPAGKPPGAAPQTGHPQPR
jgi:hypothetical protein